MKKINREDLRLKPDNDAMIFFKKINELIDKVNDIEKYLNTKRREEKNDNSD